jgi:hypothetical protein
VVDPTDEGSITNSARLRFQGEEIARDDESTFVDDNGDDDNGDDDNNDEDDFVEEVTVDDTADEDADSASADEGGVLAESGVDPDEQAPVSEPQGDVQDEIATEGPLPNTGGMSILAVVLPIAGFLVLCLSIIHRINRNR